MLTAATLGSLTLVQWAVLILVIGGVVAIVAICLRQMGITPPAFIVQVLWVIAAVVVGVLAIRFLASAF